MESDQKRVGRPPKTDSTGNVIESKTINVNVPVGLVEFLNNQKVINKKGKVVIGVNRSEMFTKVVTEMYNGEICPSCYSRGEETPVGIQCVNCYESYFHRTKEIKTFWLKFHKCLNPDCNEMYSHDNLFSTFNDPVDAKSGLFNPLKGCQTCYPEDK